MISQRLFKNVAALIFIWINRLDPLVDEMTRQRMAIGIVASLMGILFSLTSGFPLYVGGEPLAGGAFFCLAVWLVIILVVPFIIGRINITAWAYGNFIGLLVANFVATTLLGGVQSSGVMIVWSLLPPMLAPILLDRRHTIYLGFVFLVSLTAALFVPEWLGQTSSLPPYMEKGLVLFNLGGMSFFVLVSVQFFVIQRNQYQERSDNLLLNVLPREIADILRNENRVIADQFDGASILFADVVNFTPMSAAMTPTELVNLLNEVFSHFDTLVEKYGLEKIKTIGDCYMVASGVPRPRSDHAQVLTQMALEMQDYVNTREVMGRKIAFRIGINSGAVVAGVIGRKKFIYDLWGDAVNTASRMESHGSSGVIQITRATRDLIKNNFVCEPRGTVNVKGKGEMDVWSVTGAKA
jgi:guanylate cyclase